MKESECPQYMQRTWWQSVATPHTWLRVFLKCKVYSVWLPAKWVSIFSGGNQWKQFSAMKLQQVMFLYFTNVASTSTWIVVIDVFRADSRFALSHWATALLCNDVSRWLGANLESALMLYMFVCVCFGEGIKFTITNDKILIFFFVCRLVLHLYTISNDDVMAWGRFQHHWPFVKEIHQSPQDCPHEGPFMWDFDIRFNQQTIKQPSCWWFQATWRSCDITAI